MSENNEIKYLRLEDIIPNRLQPRTEFDEEKLNELASSIKQYGVINPLLVRAVGNKYEIIAGERRYKASKIAGLSQVPVIITNIDDNTSAEIAIIENIQRQNLSALEEARSYRKLLDLGNLTQEQLAHKMGKNQSTIANKMRLLNLCDEAQEALENNQISERHARSLLQLKNIDDQRNVLEKIINERMTVKTTENVIKEIIQNNSLDSTKDVIDNNVTSYPLKEDNIYGNDIVNITELNKKELEKESENMNNNEQNMQFNAQNISMDAMASQPTVEANPTSPAFGDRFFPSLEDQPTNVNLNNPFGTIPTPAPTPVQQPMMENLVDPTPVVNNVYEQQPVMPTPEQVPTAPMPESVSIPTFITNEQMVQPTINPLENAASIPNMVETQIPNVEQTTPVIPNEFIANTPQTPAGFEIPQPINNTFTEPSIPETNTITPPPVIDPTNNTVSSPQPMMPPVEQIPSEVTPIEAISPVQAPTSPVAPSVENAVIPPVENKTNDNIINAINAIKNLALSIESIGYKLTINEENTPNTYKINIELEK